MAENVPGDDRKRRRHDVRVAFNELRLCIAVQRVEKDPAEVLEWLERPRSCLTELGGEVLGRVDGPQVGKLVAHSPKPLHLIKHAVADGPAA